MAPLQNAQTQIMRRSAARAWLSEIMDVALAFDCQANPRAHDAPGQCTRCEPAARGSARPVGAPSGM